MIEEKREQHDPEACRALLERIAESSQLKRATRLRELLFYLGQHALESDNEHIREQQIGCAVFGRPESYDTNVDNIVRASVSDLRKRIETYFASEGVDETLIVDIPRGNYVPVFRCNTSLSESVPTTPTTSSTAKRRWLLGGALAVTFILGCVLGWWNGYRVQDRTVHPWKHEPSLNAFWSSFLASNANVDVVVEDSSFLVIQNLAKETFSLDEYVNRHYLITLQSQPFTPEIRAAIDLLEGKDLERAGEVRLTQRMMALDPENKELHLFNAHDFTPQHLTSDSVILLGNPTSNPWISTFKGRMNFTEISDSSNNSPVINRSPAHGEQTLYTTTGANQYCVIAYLPQLDHNGSALIVEGTTSQATEAGGNFLLSEEQLLSFQRKLGTKRIPYFELLLRVTFLDKAPLTTNIEAYRTYPDAR